MGLAPFRLVGMFIALVSGELIASMVAGYMGMFIGLIIGSVLAYFIYSIVTNVRMTVGGVTVFVIVFCLSIVITHTVVGAFGLNMWLLIKAIQVLVLSVIWSLLVPRQQGAKLPIGV